MPTFHNLDEIPADLLPAAVAAAVHGDKPPMTPNTANADEPPPLTFELVPPFAWYHGRKCIVERIKIEDLADWREAHGLRFARRVQVGHSSRMANLYLPESWFEDGEGE